MASYAHIHKSYQQNIFILSHTCSVDKTLNSRTLNNTLVLRAVILINTIHIYGYTVRPSSSRRSQECKRKSRILSRLFNCQSNSFTLPSLGNCLTCFISSYLATIDPLTIPTNVPLRMLFRSSESDRSTDN